MEMEGQMGQSSVYPCPSRQSRSSIIQTLLERETYGKSLQRLSNPFGKSIPERLNMPMESVLPIIALQNGHIFLGFTECGRFLLSYTIREDLETTYNRTEMAFFYKLHIWLFTPYKLAKRVGSVILFSNTGVADNNLLIDVSQWRNDDSRLVVLGRNYSPETGGGLRSLFYVTMTSLPSASPCSECSLQAAKPDSEDAFDVHGLFHRGKCLNHSLTTHLVYERVPPFPKFDFDIQLGLKNSIVLNTGNALHIFTYNISGPRQDSVFIPELLNPPHHPQPKKHKARLLRCDFWFKFQSPNCLQKILSNCSPHEASRIHTSFGTKTDKLTSEHEERNKDWITAQESILSNLPLSMDFSPLLPIVSEQSRSRRRLSQSSMDSETSSVSRSTNTSYQSSSQDNLDVQRIEVEQPLPSPPKRPFVGNPAEIRKGMSSSMPPPPRRRKFFKTGQLVTNARKSCPRFTQQRPSSPKQEKTYDIFEVGVEEVLLERSLSSYRKRRNADKQYEFADPDVSAENLVPLKLSRKRGRFPSSGVLLGRGSRSPRSIGSASPTHSLTSTNYDGLSLGPSGYPRSPRALTVHSPAISPNYAELGDILRPLTNYSNVNPMSPNPLFSPPPPPFTREFCEDASLDHQAKVNSRLADIVTEEKYSRARPTFTTNVNCMAKILRCYVDRDDDNLSVKTDTDDEFNVTVPFPVALNLDVHGSGNQNLQLIHNSKVKSSPTPVVEILQRTLEVEILCNEVAGMICLAADKSFISCFDYDLAILDVCPKTGSITAVAVVLIHAANLNKEFDLTGGDSVQTTYIPNVLDLRQKYEALFSFVWDAVNETCRILHVGHMREIETTPENWHPTKHILQRLEESSLASSTGPKQRVLSNELAVFEWQSLDELVDATGLIRLCSGNPSKLNLRGGMTSSNLTLANLDTEDDDDDDEDLSD